jgi:Zn-dependent protease with chaperone function
VVLRLDALALIGLAVFLATIAPAALATSAWPADNPRAALVLWQAIGLGGGFSILTAGLTFAVADLDKRWLSGLAALPSGWSRLGPLGWIGLTITVLAGFWLVAVLLTTTRRVVLVRRAHRHGLDLLSDDLVVREDGETGIELALVRLLDHSTAAAYCLPGLRPQIVLSSGAVATLSTRQLAAVVVHERAHARGRHDLVIHPFRAWQETFPFLPAARTALTAVELLVEMLADDAARQRCGTPALVSALQRMAETAPGAGEEFPARITRLAEPAWRRPVSSALVYAAAVALVIAPPMILALS